MRMKLVEIPHGPDVMLPHIDANGTWNFLDCLNNDRGHNSAFNLANAYTAMGGKLGAAPRRK